MTVGNMKDSQEQRGGTIIFFSISVVVVFLVMGLALDLGNAYVTRARLSKAVDAGALAGARNASDTNDVIKELSLSVATANYQTSNGVDYQVQITTPSQDTKRVVLTGNTASNVYFAKLLGRSAIDVGTAAEATRFPLDMSLVLDLSYSLERNDAFDDLQEASSNFLGYFSDEIDQFGLVTYSTWAEEQMPAQKSFKATGQSIINGLSAISDTNIEAGLETAKLQLDNAPQREQAFKVVVLFTDGRPTAFSDEFELDEQDDGCGDGVPQTYDGVVAAYISGASFRGLFRTADGKKVSGFSGDCSPNFVDNGSSTVSPQPNQLPGGYSVNGYNIRSFGASQAEEWANVLREAGYTIFTIGLGNPDATNDGDKPDLEFLQRLANQSGVSDPSQPRGEMVFSPSPEELDQTFALLADRIITRLTR